MLSAAMARRLSTSGKRREWTFTRGRSVVTAQAGEDGLPTWEDLDRIAPRPMSTDQPRRIRIEPLSPPRVELPSELDPRHLVRRALQIAAVLVVIGLAVVLAPGLGDVRDLLAKADPAWVLLAIAFEALSCVSYVLMFRQIFCRHMPWRTSWEIGLSELAVGSLVPASGAGGLALGAWILHQGGMPGDKIARRSVAFYL